MSRRYNEAYSLLRESNRLYGQADVVEIKTPPFLVRRGEWIRGLFTWRCWLNLVIQFFNQQLRRTIFDLNLYLLVNVDAHNSELGLLVVVDVCQDQELLR